MATRTSLTGVSISDGYPQLLHVSDTDGITAVDTQIYDANGTASALGLSSVAVSVMGSNLEFRLYEGDNYVGFEAPALTGDQIWVLPTADGDNGAVMVTNGTGTLSWLDNASEKMWGFVSPAGTSGSNYYGGFYEFGSAANDFNPVINFGTANAAKGAHVFLVQAAGASGGTDTVIRVTGTSFTDAGVRTTSDTEDLTVDDAGAAGTYYETAKKWIGLVTIELQSGPDILCNYGFCKYWDNHNLDYALSGLEATWIGGANDATPDIILRHHKATGWTYNAGAAPTPPAAVASMAADYITEIQVVNGEDGAWKLANLTESINGSASEGTIIEAVTSANRAFTHGMIILRIVPQS